MPPFWQRLFPAIQSLAPLLCCVLYCALMTSTGEGAKKKKSLLSPATKRQTTRNVPPPKRPPLTIVLVIDQFRADYLTRFEDTFLPVQTKGKWGGFRVLMEKGAYFPFASYQYVLQNMTAPGHATILTGAYPHLSGIPVNTWLDPTTGLPTESILDKNYPLVRAAQAPSAIAEEKDAIPTGYAPTNLWASTLGDELKMAPQSPASAQQGNPVVISIALKDRAAILLAGHKADGVFWVGPSGQWGTSSFYAQVSAPWLSPLNQAIAQKHSAIAAHALGVPELFGVAFPQDIALGEKSALASPYGLWLTLEATEAALKYYGLGQHAPREDLLAVSLSSHDYVGHQFGPNSPEIASMLEAEDKLLSRFFNDLEGQIPGGLMATTIALTADHGIAPSLITSAGMAGRENLALSEKAIQDDCEKTLQNKFGGLAQNRKWIRLVFDFNFYLDPQTMEQRQDDRAAIEDTLRKCVQNAPGIAYAFSQTQVETHSLPQTPFEHAILSTFVPGRSGSVVAIPKPFYLPQGMTTTHLTPYSYDKTVPLLLMGPQVRQGVYYTEASITDLAPTLSAILGIVPPSSSEGRILHEVIRSK